MNFPLPLTAFEAYMWADDSPTHPMTALYEVSYQGTIDRCRFEQAIERTLGEHPLLRSHVDTAGRKPAWKPAENADPWCSWGTVDDDVRYPGDVEYMDLTREIGVRYWVRSRIGGGRILFQIHHACADGLGVTDFVLDVLRAYTDPNGELNTPTQGRDATLLRSRGRFYRLPFFGPATMLVWAGLHMVTWIGSRPTSLATKSAPSGPSHPMDTIRERTLDRQETAQLLAVARNASVTVNDLLMRDLFLALDECSSVPSEEAGVCHCVCMPMSLRNRDDRRLPAANKMTMTFLRRTPHACRDRKALLQGIRQETQHAKRTRRGLRMIEVLRLALAFHGRVPQRLLSKSSFASAVLSNLGRIGGPEAGLALDADGQIICGDLTIDGLVTAPNGRPGTAVVIVVLTYAGQMTISLRFDPTALTSDDADRVLDEYLRHLRTTVNAADPALTYA